MRPEDAHAVDRCPEVRCGVGGEEGGLETGVRWVEGLCEVVAHARDAEEGFGWVGWRRGWCAVLLLGCEVGEEDVGAVLEAGCEYVVYDLDCVAAGEEVRC